MRQYLLMSVLVVGAGCQGLAECRRGGRDCEPSCKHEKKTCAAPARSQAAPREEVVEHARAAMAQEVLLVPRTVYVPFVAQQPTAAARLTSNMQVVQPPAPSTAQPPAQQVTPQPLTLPCPKEECPQQQILDTCRRLNQRLDSVERCIKERKQPTCAPSVNCCPPSDRLLPQLFRRPLFNRCETSRCEVICEPVIVAPGQAAQPSESLSAPTRVLSPAVRVTSEPVTTNPMTEPVAPDMNINMDPNTSAPLSQPPPQALPQPPSLPVDPQTPALPIE